jgi:phosphoribosylglycinamide formyltransferase-1
VTAPDCDNARPGLAVLLSGGGRTLANLLAKIEAGQLHAQVTTVISSRPGVRGLEIAAGAGIPAQVIERRAFASDADFSRAIYEAVAPFRPALIICAGFLKRLVVPPEWHGRILNMHPALIPESGSHGHGFYGDRVHAAVLASGATVSGATVHIVDDEYDHGPVVLKEEVPILPSDVPADLAARVFAVECDLYPRAITRHLANLAKRDATANPSTSS